MLHYFIRTTTSVKRGIAIKKVLLSLFLVSYLITNSFAQQSPGKENTLTQKFYAINHEPLHWLSSEKNLNKAAEWLKQIESEKDQDIIVDKSKSIQKHSKTFIFLP